MVDKIYEIKKMLSFMGKLHWLKDTNLILEDLNEFELEYLYRLLRRPFFDMVFIRSIIADYKGFMEYQETMSKCEWATTLYEEVQNNNLFEK